MKNYVQSGRTLTLVAAVAVLAGAGMLTGKIFGVAVTDVDAGEEGEFLTEGVVELTAASADTGSVGTVMYWDDTNKRLTTTSTSNTRVGVLTVAKVAATTTATIKLDAVIA